MVRSELASLNFGATGATLDKVKQHSRSLIDQLDENLLSGVPLNSLNQGSTAAIELLARRLGKNLRYDGILDFKERLDLEDIIGPGNITYEKVHTLLAKYKKTQKYWLVRDEIKNLNFGLTGQQLTKAQRSMDELFSQLPKNSTFSIPILALTPRSNAALKLLLPKDKDSFLFNDTLSQKEKELLNSTSSFSGRIDIGKLEQILTIYRKYQEYLYGKKQENKRSLDSAINSTFNQKRTVGSFKDDTKTCQESSDARERAIMNLGTGISAKELIDEICRKKTP